MIKCPHCWSPSMFFRSVNTINDHVIVEHSVRREVADPINIPRGIENRGVDQVQGPITDVDSDIPFW